MAKRQFLRLTDNIQIVSLTVNFKKSATKRDKNIVRQMDITLR